MSREHVVGAPLISMETRQELSEKQLLDFRGLELHHDVLCLRSCSAHGHATPPEERGQERLQRAVTSTVTTS